MIGTRLSGDTCLRDGVVCAGVCSSRFRSVLSSGPARTASITAVAVLRRCPFMAGVGNVSVYAGSGRRRQLLPLCSGSFAITGCASIALKRDCVRHLAARRSPRKISAQGNGCGLFGRMCSEVDATSAYRGTEMRRYAVCVVADLAVLGITAYACGLEANGNASV